MSTVDQLENEDRYTRFRLIPWWNQEKISATRVLVVGAGALGNEILKNLALLGFRQIVLFDLDRVEASNLSRSVLFREQDLGRLKAEVAAASLKTMSTEVEVRPFAGNIMYDCGLGLFAWSDVIIAGLDNREARLFINRSAWKMNRPWIDGAIEGINGVARVFLPGSVPCYECTLGEMDWALLERRMSCNLLTRHSDTAGKIPTTPTISAIIAGIQVQEAVKLIHGLPTLAGRGFVFEGLNHTSYVVEYTENSTCMSHYTLERVVDLQFSSLDKTLHELWERACADLKSNNVVLEFSREVIQNLTCPACGHITDVFAPVGTVHLDDGKCPKDGSTMTVNTLHGYSGTGAITDMNLRELGLPLFDVFTARCGSDEIGYRMAGDMNAVLGPLAAKDLEYGKAKA
jgi:molybdopterin/thiamine biosynthesis adenylyltransferase